MRIGGQDIQLDGVVLTEENAHAVINLMVEHQLDEPIGQAKGTGYVMCAGGRYEKHAYATCAFIRAKDPDATIQVWHGIGEYNLPFERALDDHGAELRGGRIAGGWPLKSHAVKNCGLERVIFLDSDCVPLLPMEQLLDAQRETGALLFPDITDHRRDSWMWHYVGARLEDVPEMEAGQFVINRKTHWRAIQLYDWLNQQPMCYKHLHGDKEILALSMARMKSPFTMGRTPLIEPWGLRHLLPDGTPAFDHRIHTKQNPISYSEEIDAYEKEYQSMTGKVVA